MAMNVERTVVLEESDGEIGVKAAGDGTILWKLWAYAGCKLAIELSRRDAFELSEALRDAIADLDDDEDDDDEEGG
jgi:hypothetical protein